MARHVFASLTGEVRCDPGALARFGPYSDEFVAIDAAGARVIIWADEPEDETIVYRLV